MQVDHHGIDIIRRPAVMVYHADLGNGFKQGSALHLIRPVGVHHHENAPVVRHQQGVLAGHEHIPVFRNRLDFLDQLLGGVVFQIDDDIGLLAFFPAQAADAHGRAHGVQVGVFVSHDEHPAALADQLHQGIGRHTGAHLAAVIRFPVPSAVEIEVDPILDDRLIAATAQRHLDAQGGKVIAFLEALSVHAQADGNGGGQAGGIDDLVNVFQQGELVFLRPF